MQNMSLSSGPERDEELSAAGDPRPRRIALGTAREKFNPLREPAWRDIRVRELLTRMPKPGQPSRVWDDEHVVAWYRFNKLLARLDGSPREKKLRELFRLHPELYYAWFLRTAGDQESSAIVQARILAGQSDVEIAREFNTLPGAIQAYTRIFFDVRDRLQAQSAILKTVLGPAALRSGDKTETLDPFRTGVCYQLFGYFGGVEALEFLLFGMQHLPVPLNGMEAQEWTRQVAEAAIQRKTAMAAQMMEVTKYNVVRLVELNLKLKELSLLEANASGGNRDKRLEEIVSVFLQDNVQMTIGRKGFAALAQDGLEITSPVELRADMLTGSDDLAAASQALQREFLPATARLNVAARHQRTDKVETGQESAT